MDMQSALRAVTERRDLSAGEMIEVMRTVMTGGATPAQIGGLMVGLRMKGETVEEIAAAAQVMRELASRVEVSGPHLVDTCGTGGDGRGTFNVSTCSAFVAAAAGARVAKHGNRSVSSRSGSADVLEAAGININLTPAQVAQCVERVGVGFMFAPLHHGAMKHAIGPRREMGVRTLFNLLGPLTNPAGALNQVIGVYSARWLEPMARVLARLGSRHVMVVHGEDVLDEISIGAVTRVAELKDDEVRSYSLTPEQFGIERADIQSLVVKGAAESLALLRAVLADTPGPARDIVLLNAGAAIYTAGLAPSLEQGVERAREALRSGAALRKFEALAAISKEF
jgi:anthranilate phosphoribosyltransferase